MEELATEAGKVFLTQGILGALAVILLGAVVFLYRERSKCDDRRFEELSKILEARESIARALNANSLALEANNKAMEARTRTSEDMVREITELRRIVESAVQQGVYKDERTQDKLSAALSKLDAALQQRGVA